MPVISGTQGYADEADNLAVQYESFTFEALHKDIIPLFPKDAKKALDIGAGTGRDAAGLAGMGLKVLAVEPVAEMRAHARRLHPSPRIEWLEDSLPQLAQVHARGETFEIVMMTAVLMHFDAAERALIMARVVPLLAPQGVLALSLRHGPVPPGRRMFAVSDEDVIAIAASHHLAPVLTLSGKRDKFQRDDVTWSRLVLKRRD